MRVTKSTYKETNYDVCEWAVSYSRKTKSWCWYDTCDTLSSAMSMIGWLRREDPKGKYKIFEMTREIITHEQAIKY